MSNYCLKKPSKAKTCRHKYKVAKKVREHLRKERRTAKKKGTAGIKKRNEIKVPNKCPFKDEVLADIKQQQTALQELRADRVKSKESKTKKKEKREKELKENKKKSKLQEGTLEQLVGTVATKQNIFESTLNIASSVDVLTSHKATPQRSTGLKTYAGEVRKVIDAADVVFEVLDARDPLGSRNEQVERAIIGAGKRLVLLLNKIDLVPKANVEAWLVYLRRVAPTVAFKASTQEQRQQLGRAQNPALASAGSKCLGADIVMKLLGNYCRNRQVKVSIRVGVIGYPNVGKSSVINSLKRKRTCVVGATPGVTKQMQEVELGRLIKLLDSPGVVLAEGAELDPVEYALKNAVRIESLADPIQPVVAILRRCSPEMLTLQYKIAEFADANEFLANVARKIGALKKGAQPDLNSAARKVLQDWTSGRLRYYTQPPEDVSQTVCTTQLLTVMAAEFSLDAITDEHLKMVDDLPSSSPIDTPYDATVPAATITADDKYSTVARSAATKRPAVADDDPMTGGEAREPGNQQLNKVRKADMKKKRKRATCTSKMTDKLAAVMSTKMDIS